MADARPGLGKADQRRVNALRIQLGNMPVGAGLWISEVSFSKLDASSRDPRSHVSLQVPLDTTRQARAGEVYLRSMSGLRYETEVGKQVAEIDRMAGTRDVRRTDATNVPGMLILGFEPSRADTRFIKRRSGSVIVLDRSAVAGRLQVSLGTRTLASWRFDRGWFFALDSARVAPGSPGDVLFVPGALRRG